MINAYLAEFFGTALLVFLGDSVVAGVLLNRSKAFAGGWWLINAGWGLAVTFAVYLAGIYSGAHINPAVTLGLAAGGQFDWALVPGYLLAQVLGALIGAVLVYFHYYPHWRITEDADAKLGVFATAPAIHHVPSNFFSEFMGTFILLLGLMALGANSFSEGLNPLVVGLLVVAIGASMGGTTGYAINPARDLGPRIAHALLPIPGKRDSDWRYGWIPVVAPIVGGIAGVLFYLFFFGVREAG